MKLARPHHSTALTLLGVFHASDIREVCCVGYTQPPHAVRMLPLGEVTLEGLGASVGGIPTDLTRVAQVEAV